MQLVSRAVLLAACLFLFQSVTDSAGSGGCRRVKSLPKSKKSIGKCYELRVTGGTSGRIWGTDIYTSDSRIGTAAVHAGLLRVGQTGYVRVRLLAGRNSYRGSTRHGVRTKKYGRWKLSYKFVGVSGSSSSTRVRSKTHKRTTTKRIVSKGGCRRVKSLPKSKKSIGKCYELRVTGGTSGRIWGTDIYTSDSRIGTAAVHAGLLRVGQTGYVRVRLLAGRNSYRGSTRHGVRTKKYGRWKLSYKFVGVSGSSSSTRVRSKTHKRTTTKRVVSKGGKIRRAFYRPMLGRDGCSRLRRTPVNMQAYRRMVGTCFDLLITGTASGKLWGTDIYTGDSTLGMAAVHDGLLKVGQTKYLRLRVLPGRGSYSGSRQSGITSKNYRRWSLSYQFLGVAHSGNPLGKNGTNLRSTGGAGSRSREGKKTRQRRTKKSNEEQEQQPDQGDC
ncbi:hypothetical protein BOX15_Mlig028021g3 [Macrostomum lignano]|uniref:LCCL domain-containing protein n=2 Tax=Macrostomum lignano TaxID=282301 RepID=A0A267DFT3_9PLAT|nr:hypothetical protein BOX15_Mlig028021g3 [Macrostomum lignano]